MPAYLADTNVVFRWATPGDPLHPVCLAAIERLTADGEPIFVTAQIVTEFWALATRPVEANGLGLPVTEAARLCRVLLARFPLLPETAAIFPRWLALVEAQGIIGRQVYDARLAAVMLTHDVTHILTMNGNHFRRFPGITVVEPATLQGP